jgi:hypothetical protein
MPIAVDHGERLVERPHAQSRPPHAPFGRDTSSRAAAP